MNDHQPIASVIAQLRDANTQLLVGSTAAQTALARDIIGLAIKALEGVHTTKPVKRSGKPETVTALQTKKTKMTDEERKVANRAHQRAYLNRLREKAKAGDADAIDTLARARGKGNEENRRIQKREYSSRESVKEKRRHDRRQLIKAAHAGEPAAAARVRHQNVVKLRSANRANKTHPHLTNAQVQGLKRTIARREARKLLRKSADYPVSIHYRLMQIPPYAAASAAVPNGYPQHVRDDIISAVVLRFLEEPDLDIRSEAKRQISAYWGNRPEYRMASMDENRFDDGDATLHDVIPASDPNRIQ